MFNMRKFIADYSNNNRDPFNEELFIRSEYDIIEQVKNIILSVCNGPENSGQIYIGVNYFNVIDDYRKVRDILSELESKEKRHNKRIDYNIHDYINLKDSDVILLEVNYHIEVNGTMYDGSVYIDIPKVINKYYFRIAGTIYSTLYQIADASTYNNAQNKKRDRHISFRQVFQKHNVYEKKTKLDAIDLDSGNAYPVDCINYTTDLFGNNIPLCKYFLAKYGLIKAAKYLMLSEMYINIDKPYVGNKDANLYFNKDNVWITVPKYFWNNCPVLQSFVYAVINNVSKRCDTLEKICSIDYWLMSLGADFKNKSVEKGLSMLDSVDRNYDISMRDELRLPDEDKQSLFDVLRWEMYEFEALYNKDNYDMTYKKLRVSSYIAGFYAAKISHNLIKATNGINNSLTAEKLFKTLNIQHDFILDCLKKSNLVSYKNSVNDDDIFSVLKYTFKGVSGIGENKASAVPVKYRLANPSHIGKVDCDTSPAGDPGMTGLVCPYADIGAGKYLGDYKEPCTWREVQQEIMDDYRKISSTKSVFMTHEEMLGTPQGRAALERFEQIIKGFIGYTVAVDP